MDTWKETHDLLLMKFMLCMSAVVDIILNVMSQNYLL